MNGILTGLQISGKRSSVSLELDGRASTINCVVSEVDMLYRDSVGEQHTVGKLYTQKIERKHLSIRTRIQRLARKTICCSRV